MAPAIDTVEVNTILTCVTVSEQSESLNLSVFNNFQMKIAAGLVLLSLPVFVAAQRSETYYDYQTRYGTFRSYSNGGSKMISGIDYAAQQAQAQEATARARRERAANRNTQQKGQSQQSSSYPSAAEEEARRKRNEENERQRQAQAMAAAQAIEQRKLKQYNELKESFEKATELNDQILALQLMDGLFQSESNSLTLFGLYARTGNSNEMGKLEGTYFSESLKKQQADFIAACYGEAYYRKGDYTWAAMKLESLEVKDLNSFSQLLCSYMWLGQWTKANSLLASEDAKELAPIQPILEALKSGISLMETSKKDTAEASATAAKMYAFALARREAHAIDFLNILALNIAVSLAPRNDIYREERFNCNAMQKDKVAMRADHYYFTKGQAVYQ